jgi:hypothetical protein
MRRALVLPPILAIGFLLAACGQSTAAPVSAKPTSVPTPSASATVQRTPGLVLFDKSGSGSYRSNTFTTHGEWDLTWEGESAPNSIGSFLAITIYASDGSPVASTIEVDLGPPNSKKSDVVHMHYAGAVSIDIQGVGSWHIKAVGT